MSVEKKAEPVVTMAPELEAFLKKEKAFVVDEAASSRRRLIDMLISMGMNKDSVFGYGKIEEVESNFEKHNPKILISEFQVGSGYGFDLMQMQRQKIKDHDSIACILVTANSGQSAVARAAEEEVDGFILKPYTLHSLRNSLTESLQNKLFPSAYYRKINEGKQLLYSGEVDKSLFVFNMATLMDKSPTLAFYYLAQANFMKKMVDQSASNYDECLKINKIHYKALVGLFELFMNQKKIIEAYGIMRKIMEFFPANPVRMTTAVRLAIVTKNYEDIEKYYTSFLTVEPRTDELVRYICSGLVVVGINHFKNKAKDRALTAMSNAAVTSAGSPTILRKIIETLVEYGAFNDVQPFLNRFANQTDHPDYIFSKFILLYKRGDHDGAYLMAPELAKNSDTSVEKYCALMNFYITIKKLDLARSVYADAIKKWPDEPKFAALKPVLFAN